jgi:pectinesterase
MGFYLLKAQALIWVTVDPSIPQSDPDNLVYKTVQDAVSDAVASALPEQVCIFIKNGTYGEVFIGNKDVKPVVKISLIGQSRDGVIIESTNWFGKKGFKAQINPTDSVWFDRNTSAALYVNGPTDGTANFYAENITFRNLSGRGHEQEEANVIYVRDLDGFAFKNIKVDGYKAALEYKKGRRSFFYKCDVSAADKLFKSGGTSMIYRCNLKALADGASYTNPEDIIYGEKSGEDTIRYGFIFRECTLTKGDTVKAGTCYLGYPNAYNSGTVYIDCKMDDHIAPVGWKLASEYANKWSYLGEYNSMKLDGTPLDVSQRGNYGIQIPQSDVFNYLNLNRVYEMYTYYKGQGKTFPRETRAFRPDSMVVAPAAPQGVVVNGKTITWNAVNGAEGYVVLRDGALAGFTATNSFTDQVAGTQYTVYAHNKYGALSYPSGSTDVEMTIDEMYRTLFAGSGDAISGQTMNRFAYSLNDGIFRTTEPCRMLVFNLTGICVKVVDRQQELSLHELNPGIYFIKAINDMGQINVAKVVR